ncbi:MAG: site-2 protease family protein [Chloroflexi bacterium]|nr:site-2 protease family protein [Chloroflexota bacterium]
MLTIVAFLGTLVILIIAHELGHFITAKLSGVKVEEFGIGFPPRLFAVKRGETEYSINLIPLGGFCRMLGEEDPKELRSLASKSKRTRALILSAGSLMNVLLPLLLFTASYMVPHQVLLEQVRVETVHPGSPAEKAGINPGDRILEVNGETARNRGDLTFNIRRNLGSEITLLVKQGEDPPRTLYLTPRWNPPPDQGAIGVILVAAEPTAVTESLPVWRAIPAGVQSTMDTLVLFRNEIATWFIKKQAPQLAGPIGIVHVTGEVVQTGFGPLLSFAALISINLAVFNLLPIPGLDGGRLLFVLLELIMGGRRISPQKERLIHFIGFAMLIALVVFVSYFDIMRIAAGESPTP